MSDNHFKTPKEISIHSGNKYKYPQKSMGSQKLHLTRKRTASIKVANIFWTKVDNSGHCECANTTQESFKRSFGHLPITEQHREHHYTYRPFRFSHYYIHTNSARQCSLLLMPSKAFFMPRSFIKKLQNKIKVAKKWRYTNHFFYKSKTIRSPEKV